MVLQITDPLKRQVFWADVVKQLGDFKTSSVEAYMQALSKFKKGDATVLVYKRGADEIKIDIVF